MNFRIRFASHVAAKSSHPLWFSRLTAPQCVSCRNIHGNFVWHKVWYPPDADKTVPNSREALKKMRDNFYMSELSKKPDDFVSAVKGVSKTKRGDFLLKRWWNFLRALFTFDVDLYMSQKPSALEIERRQLPENTPSLRERERRIARLGHTSEGTTGICMYGETGTWRDQIDPKWTAYQMWKMGIDDLALDLKKIKKEWKDSMNRNWATFMPKSGESRPYFQFDTHAKLDKWQVTSDSQWGEGYSTCSLTRSKAGHALFSGVLDTRVPQDGRIVKTGFVNITSIGSLRYFNVPAFLPQVEEFTHIYLVVRGDGRHYALNLRNFPEFNINMSDIHSAPLFTSGGPYWQYTRIPFSKFIFMNKGKVGTEQKGRLIKSEIMSVGITLADNFDGPFSLELKEIGFYKGSETQEEECAYETYVTPYRNYDAY